MAHITNPQRPMNAAEVEVALEDNQELVDRFASGDVHALDSLLEAVTGVPVVSSESHPA